MPQHFVAPPQWEWYIVWYFFLGGISGGAYVLGTLLGLVGDRRDAPLARLAFLISLPALLICPVLLTLDLGHPLRFWHMMLDARTMTPNFKYWSPMSVGVWVLVVFSAFSFVSFVAALAGRLLQSIVTIVGSLFGLALAGYTGVLLSVSNQPVWSDTWTLGGLFLASGLSVSAATIGLLASLTQHEDGVEAKLGRADRYFIVLELILLALFFVSLGAIASRFLEPRWLGLWILVALGTLVPLALRGSPRRVSALIGAGLVLVGGLALRIVVIFAAQV